MCQRVSRLWMLSLSSVRLSGELLTPFVHFAVKQKEEKHFEVRKVSGAASHVSDTAAEIIKQE